MGQLQTEAADSSAGFTGWDVSVPIYAGIPTDPPIEIATVSSVKKGDSATVSALKIGSHTGTHIDAPSSFLPDASGADDVPLANLIGRARVIEIQGRTAT